MMKKFTLKAYGGKNASHGVRKECPMGQNHANLFSNKYFIEKKNKSSQGLPVWRHINGEIPVTINDSCALADLAVSDCCFPSSCNSAISDC